MTVDILPLRIVKGNIDNKAKRSKSSGVSLKSLVEEDVFQIYPGRLEPSQIMLRAKLIRQCLQIFVCYLLN